MAGLILVSNPGSASRKYALFDGETCRAQLHFEYSSGHVVCTLSARGRHAEAHAQTHTIETAAQEVLGIFQKTGILAPHEQIDCIGLRVVAPGSFFLRDHVMTDDVEQRLAELAPRAPLHISAALAELRFVRQFIPGVPVVGVSDSAYHATKPAAAMHYGIPYEDAAKHDIKKFGYHGLSAAAVVAQLRAEHRLPEKLVVCHLGSGASVMAFANGKTVDTTMGFSPLEGLVMATRSGSLDITAAHALKTIHTLDDSALDEYLNTKSGLLGLSGVSSGVRELAELEATNPRAKFALDIYALAVKKAIGQMAAVLGGADMLVFTGTVGERSAPMRAQIVTGLDYLGFTLDTATNAKVLKPHEPIHINLLVHSKQIWVIPTDEAAQIAKQAALLQES